MIPEDDKYDIDSEPYGPDSDENDDDDNEDDSTHEASDGNN